MQKLSIIVPLYNEEGNLIQLYSEIIEVLKKEISKKILEDYEIIFVNDGSKDNSQKLLEELKKKDKKIKIIELRKNFGQTPALKAGFDNCSGDLIVTMDADLQNDPRDIPRLIEKLEKGYDVVSGWRKNRRDSFFKKIVSRMMNNLRFILIGDFLHDYGCSLKIYKKECIKDLELFGELHRYITAYLYIKGYRVGEIPVNHRPRKFGRTKYNIFFGRGLNGILDLLFLKFWHSYSNKPLHFFGRLGIYQWVLAGLIAIEQILIEPLFKRSFDFGPLLALASMLVITGLLFLIFGFLSEIMIRTYFRGDKKIYTLK